MDAQGHLLHNENIVIQNGFNKFNYPISKFKNYRGNMIIYLQTEYNIKKTLRQLIAH
jgi:hypothetical protein